MWCIVFFIATPGASSAHLTISEIFPSVFIILLNLTKKFNVKNSKHMRSQALAIFFSVGEGVGGVIAPTIFGILISENSRFYVFVGYMICRIFNYL